MATPKKVIASKIQNETRLAAYLWCASVAKKDTPVTTVRPRETTMKKRKDCVGDVPIKVIVYKHLASWCMRLNGNELHRRSTPF